jgi:hypothetical protein
MNKFSIIVLLALLALGLTQNDIEGGVLSSKPTGPLLGGWAQLDLTSFENTDEERLVTEAVDQSRAVYEADISLENKDALDAVVSVKRQMVAGFLYKIRWSTTSGKQVEITVHQVPWKEAPESRYPKLDNPILLV